MTPTSRFATDGIISGQQSLFYWVNGLLVSANFELSILMMRFLNSVILLSLLILAAKSSSADANVRLRVVLLSISIPVCFWTVTSNSSSSWTFLGTAFAWFFLDSLLIGPERTHKSFAIVGLLLSIFLSMGSRSESAPFLLVQFAAFLGLRFHSREWMVQNIRLVRLAIVGFALLGYVFYSTEMWVFFTDAFGYVRDDTPIMRPSSWVLLHNFQSIPLLYYWLISSIGVLNATDFEFPETVGILTSTVLAIILYESLRQITKRSQLILLLILFTALVVPLIVLQSNTLLVGEELLPRYLFPLFVLLVGFSVFQRSLPFTLGRGQALFIASGLSLAHLIVLRLVILRHTVGIEQFGLFDLDSGIEWWWTLDAVPSPMTVWYVGSVSFSVLAFSTLKRTTRSSDEQVSDAALSDPSRGLEVAVDELDQ